MKKLRPSPLFPQRVERRPDPLAPISLFFLLLTPYCLLSTPFPLGLSLNLDLNLLKHGVL